MSNQWGRDSQLPSGRGAGIGTVLAVVIALLLGAAGTYGYLRLAQPDQSPELATLRREAETLRKSLADMEARLARSDAGLSQAQAELSETKAALKALQSAEASRDPEAASLRAKLAAQTAELDTMTERLAAASTAEQAAIAEARSLAGKVAEEKAVLAEQLRTAEQATAAAVAETLRLETEIASLRRDAQRTSSDTGKTLAELQQTVIPALKAENLRLQREAQGLAEERTNNLARIDALTRQAESDRVAMATLESRLAEQARKVEALQQQLAQKPAEPAAVNPEPAATPTPPETGPTPALKARAAADVEAALNRAPGLGGLTDIQRAQLKAALESGACVTTALEGVFERVPVITLRNLIRDLKSGC